MFTKQIPTVKVKHPSDPKAHFAWGGTSYQPAKDGTFEVPAEAAEDLRWHGFVVVEDAQESK